MLTLRQDWSSVTSGAVAADLVGQPGAMRLRDEVARHLIGASLDLLVSTWPRKEQPPLTVETISKAIWKIEHIYYVYLRTNDDRTLSTCIRLSRSETVTVIAPRRYERLKRQLLTALLHGRTPCIWALDAFISYRTLFASADQAWSHRRVLLELLSAYNRRVNSAGCSDALLVRTPEELP